MSCIFNGIQKSHYETDKNLTYCFMLKFYGLIVLIGLSWYLNIKFDYSLKRDDSLIVKAD
ncbi:hypothetical protein BpHYR1_016703 [Brachionus plicatilis]|uniref:Uncharacterized protein n=1 Tax=Brachionus plicatilis TaxID=10195 RepID=A0A3M7RH13_BRAPC|nr:hypothetical protein BpHYR1_016703 [Brachionus plicatilis]